MTKVNFVDLRDYLLENFPSKDQLFLLPSVDSDDLPLSRMTVEQIESVIFRKQSNDVCSIVAGDFKLDFDTLKASHESVDEDEQFGVEMRSEILRQLRPMPSKDLGLIWTHTPKSVSFF